MRKAAPSSTCSEFRGSITGTLQDDFGRYGTRAQQDLLRRSFTYVAQHVGQKIAYAKISRESRAADVARALDLRSLT